MTYADQHQILNPLQHGFRKGLSCDTQLVEFIDDITNNLDVGRQTDCLIMDFSKAFDKVSHCQFTKQQETGRSSRGRNIRLHQCGIKSTSSLSNWTKPIPVLYQ